MSYYGFPFGSWSVSHAAMFAVAVSAAGGALLITGETDALGIDFTYHTDRTKQMEVITASVAVDSDPYATLTYTSPSIKLCRQSDGVWRYGSHNLYLNSAVPADQAVTVVASGTYSVVITGSVSITVSGAATATYTSGTNNFTAATTTLTCGSTSGSGTVAVFRTPCVGTYLATAGAIKIDLPYEWNVSNVSQGILIEEARTNLGLRSQEASNAFFPKNNVAVTADNTTAPDGTTTADKVTASATNSDHTLIDNTTSLAAVNNAISVFAKKSTHGFIYLTMANGGGSNWLSAVFDLDGGGSSATQTSATNATLVSTSQIDAGNGWYRLTLVGSVTSGASVNLYGLAGAATGNTIGSFGDHTWNAAGTEAAWMWGMQIEVGSFASSPIHTIAATVTRAVDTISLTASGGFPVSSTLGTLYAKFNPINVGAIRYALAQDDDTANEHFSIGSSAAGAGQFNVVDGGAAQTAPLTNGTVTAGSANKIAASWVVNDFAVSTNGTAVSTDVSGTLPTVTKLKFGVGNTSTNVLNGYLQHVVSLPRSMTDPQLVTIST